MGDSAVEGNHDNDGIQPAADTSGLDSRTQSYTSITSSRLPDYDFGEDDNPRSYKGKKEKKKPDKKKKPKSSVSKKESKKKTNGEGEKSKKDKKEKKNKKDSDKETKNKKSKKSKNEDSNKNKKKAGKSKKDQKDEPSLSESVVEEDKLTCAGSGDETTSVGSRDPSVTSQKPVRKKKRKKKGLNLFPDKNAKSRDKNKRNSTTRKDSDVNSCTDVTTDYYTTDDEHSNKKKDNKKVDKNRNLPVVVVVTDDDDVSSAGGEIAKPKLCCGACAPPSKKEPLVYNCCMCCSLGAGTLISGIIFTLFCIGFLVIRAEEFKKRTVGGIWNGRHLLPDVWRLFLIVGFISASICLLASVLLVIASCLWGSKLADMIVHDFLHHQTEDTKEITNHYNTLKKMFEGKTNTRLESWLFDQHLEL